MFSRIGTITSSDLREVRNQIRSAATAAGLRIQRFERLSGSTPTLLRSRTDQGVLVGAAVNESPILQLGSFADAGWEPSWEVSRLDEALRDMGLSRPQDTPPPLPRHLGDMTAFPRWAVCRDPQDRDWVSNGAILGRPSPKLHAAIRRARDYDGRVWCAFVEEECGMFGGDDDAQKGCVRFVTPGRLGFLWDAPPFAETVDHPGSFGEAYAELLAETPARASAHNTDRLAPAYGYDADGGLRFILMPVRSTFVNGRGQK